VKYLKDYKTQAISPHNEFVRQFTCRATYTQTQPQPAGTARQGLARPDKGTPAQPMPPAGEPTQMSF